MLNTIPLGPRHNLQQRAVRPAATAAPPRVVRTAIATSTAVVFTLTPTENNIHRKNNFSSLFLFQLTLHPTGCGAEVVSVLADLTAQAPHRDVEAAPGLLRPLPVLHVDSIPLIFVVTFVGMKCTCPPNGTNSLL